MTAAVTAINPKVFGFIQLFGWQPDCNGVAFMSTPIRRSQPRSTPPSLHVRSSAPRPTPHLPGRPRVTDDRFESKPRSQSKDGLSDQVRTLGDRLGLRSALVGPQSTGAPDDARWRATLRASAEVHELVDRLVAQGRFGEAREALQQYASSRLAQEPVQPRSGIDSNHRSRYVTFRVTDDQTPSTFAAQARVRLAQVELSAEASRLVGRPLNLERIGDARAYFETLARRGDPEAVRSAFASYLPAFYTHSGSGADWTRTMTPSARVTALEHLTADLPRDVARRQLIDCEGFGMLTERLLGNLRDGTGQPMFTVQHAVSRDRTHVLATVTDRQGRGFVVNNAEVSPALEPRHHARRLAGLGQGAHPFIVGLSIDAAHAQE